jgi:ATP-dependent protease HslVU (ClpYQ) peptidase subunit
MTVIAAVAREGRITIAADTASHEGATRFLASPKIRRYPGDVLLAGAGLASLLQALRDPATIPSRATDDLDEWAQSTAEKITGVLLAQQPPMVEDGSLNGELILGYGGRLWYIDANYAVPCHAGIGVIGSGSDVAFGAITAYLERGASSYTAVTQAVAIACQRNAGCALVDGAPQVECA